MLGDFNDVRVSIDEVEYHFRRDSAKYIVDVTEIDGTTASHEIEYTFGVEPLQQYITRFAGGRHQVLRVSWDSDREKGGLVFWRPVFLFVNTDLNMHV